MNKLLGTLLLSFFVCGNINLTAQHHTVNIENIGGKIKHFDWFTAQASSIQRMNKTNAIQLLKNDSCFAVDSAGNNPSRAFQDSYTYNSAGNLNTVLGMAWNSSTKAW